MPKVLIPNKSHHDFRAAKEFGELTFMSHGPINRFNPNEMARMFEEHIANSSPTDYLVCTGLAVQFGVACAMFAAKHKRLNLLIWKQNRKHPFGQYVKRELVFEENEEGEANET
jgi:hypothetical protein